MATFENPRVGYLHVRLNIAAGGQKFVRVPYNWVEYDDNSGGCIEPMSVGLSMNPYTFTESAGEAVNDTHMYVDIPPGAGVTEFK